MYKHLDTRVNISVLGWAGCPLELYNTNSCNTNRTWTTAPLKWATVMATYKQYATTAYNRQNFSIIDVRPTANLEPMPVNASDYLAIFKKIMIPTSAATDPDRAAIYSLIYTLTWLHRTYRGSFPDDQNSLVTNLHNFLAIPLQFTVTAVQFANYTVVGGKFPLPEDTATVATDGWSKSRLAIQPWTGWLFIVAAAAMLLAVMTGILWILGEASLAPATGIRDFDTLRLAGRIKVKRERRRDGEREDAITLIDFARVTDIDSAWGLAKEMRGWKVIADDVEET